MKKVEELWFSLEVEFYAIGVNNQRICVNQYGEWAPTVFRALTIKDCIAKAELYCQILELECHYPLVTYSIKNIVAVDAAEGEEY